MIPVKKIRQWIKYLLTGLAFIFVVQTIRLHLANVGDGDLKDIHRRNALQNEMSNGESIDKGGLIMDIPSQREAMDKETLQRDAMGHNVVANNLLVGDRLGPKDGPVPKETDISYMKSHLGHANLTEYHLALEEPERLRTTRRMIYNRVPKCGSVTMWNTMTRIRRKNNFHAVASNIYDPPWIDEAEQKEAIIHINGLREPFIYNRHLCFLDFPKFGYQMPIYVNLIRHPVDRFVSSYYYQRDLRKKRITKEEYDVDINQCLERNFTECTLKGTFMLVPFFCGHGKECLQKTTTALTKAKENAVLYYGAVGILEEFQSFLKLLGCVIPQYFDGIDKVYKGKKANTTKNKGVKISDPNARKLAEHMSLEVEFYQFIKDRFYFLRERLKTECNF